MTKAPIKDSALASILLEAAHNVPIGMFVFDSSGECLFSNERFNVLTTFDGEENLEQLWSRTIGETERYGVMAAWRSMLLDGKDFRIECPIRTSQSSTTWVAMLTSPILSSSLSNPLYVGTIRDISGRRFIEQELKNSLHFLDSVIEHIPDMIFIKDALDLRFVRFNKAGEELIGVKREDLIGKNDFDLFPREQAEAFVHKDREVLNQRNTFLIPEEPITTAQGQQRILRTRKITLTDSNGDARYLVGISEDITDAKETEVQLRKAKESAEEASAMKSRFLANMSHEIRTPMNAVIGMTDLLLLTELTNEQKDYLQTVQNSTRSLLELINDILDFSRIEAGRLSITQNPFNLHACMFDLCTLFGPRFQRGSLKYSLEIGAGVPQFIIGDEGRIRQILINLIGNATKFTPEGGSIRIAINAEQVSPSSSRIRFEVQDTGIGISVEKQAMIFDPFMQADNSLHRTQGGTGLGLAISSQLATMMNGTLTVSSTPMQGSTFVFTTELMLLTPEQQLKAQSVKPESADTPHEELHETTAKRPLNILVAEDNATNQKLVQIVLNKAGHTVQLASNGREALDLLQTGTFDIILMDVQMPEIDGYEATSQIRAREANGATHVPIIGLTAHAHPKHREECLKAGMDEYISKPFDRRKLLAKIEALTKNIS